MVLTLPRPGAMALLSLLLAGGTAAGQSGLPTWKVAPPAQRGLSELWRVSTAARRERVACLAGTVDRDTVWITEVKLLDEATADSLNASAEPSLSGCGAPAWIGTAHTHVRSTDDPTPAPRFSPGDRAVMSEWAVRWKRAGAFCVLYSARGAHCEVYPPRVPPRALPDS
jgi:hypothetical protein